MDFSLRRVGNENMHYYESETDSSIQLVFIPGGFNPELWKHQLRYFSRNFKTISFYPTQSFRDWEGEKRALENVLEKDGLENVVLVSNFWGNPMAQELEEHEDVVATVFTGLNREVPGKSKSRYSIFWNFGSRNPKIFKKSLFSEDAEYRVVKDFAEDLEVPDYSDMESFRQRKMRRPVKPSLVIHADEDNYSSLEFARELEGSVSISVIERAGTFSFYEKPQEYNKALNDFLTRLEKAVEEKQIIETKQKNRSLFEFENSQGNKKKKQKTLVTK